MCPAQEGAMHVDRMPLLRQWLREEEGARMKGWDFSHLRGRYEEENDLPWDYRQEALARLTPDCTLLDIDTGGGEFLLSLGHPYEKTSATEGYAPNVQLCEQTLKPLGIDFRRADGGETLPFDGGRFNVILNRHGDYRPEEMYRLLKAGGVFLTEQVGAENDRELVELLLDPAPVPPFPEQYLDKATAKLERCGFKILKGQEAFQPIIFWDVGALVWFARVLPWEFPGFSVRRCLDRLYRAQQALERDGKLQGRIHRFLVVAQKS